MPPGAPTFGPTNVHCEAVRFDFHPTLVVGSYAPPGRNASTTTAPLPSASCIARPCVTGSSTGPTGVGSVIVPLNDSTSSPGGGSTWPIVSAAPSTGPHGASVVVVVEA